MKGGRLRLPALAVAHFKAGTSSRCDCIDQFVGIGLENIGDPKELHDIEVAASILVFRDEGLWGSQP